MSTSTLRFSIGTLVRLLGINPRKERSWFDDAISAACLEKCGEDQRCLDNCERSADPIPSNAVHEVATKYFDTLGLRNEPVKFDANGYPMGVVIDALTSDWKGAAEYLFRIGQCAEKIRETSYKEWMSLYNFQARDAAVKNLHLLADITCEDPSSHPHDDFTEALDEMYSTFEEDLQHHDPRRGIFSI